MKFRPIPTLVCAALACIGPVSGQSVSDNAFFQKMVGAWTGKGQLTSKQGTAQLQNDIQAAFSDDGAMFAVKGTLRVDQTEVPYRWEFRPHVIEGQYLGKFITDATSNIKLDAEYEVSIDEADLSATLNQTSGSSGGARVVLRQHFEGEEYIVDIQFFDSQNNETVKGQVRFQRVSSN